MAALALAAILLALGAWQIERRARKLDLIARVDARLAAAPGPAPGPSEWPSISRAEDEYRRVVARGGFLPGASVRVMAVTERGPGSWLLVPFRTDSGDTILVNRGFVPPNGPADAPSPARSTVEGLLRITEPGGGFLRTNDPASGRWYSRDVEAIAATLGLGAVAPYFIDSDASANEPGQPVGGLTVVAFRNHHLVYALTWFALAAMSLAGALLLLRVRND